MFPFMNCLIIISLLISASSFRVITNMLTTKSILFDSQSPSKAWLEKYNYIIIDQWGVLHNGKIPYDKVVESLHKLKSNGKCLILLSNSSKRKSSSFSGLKKVGIDPLLFENIVTSGEIGYDILTSADSFIGQKLFVIGNGDDDIEYVASAGCTISSLEQASGILARGTFSILNGIDDQYKYKKGQDLIGIINPWLVKCIQYKLPMLVTNPDYLRPGTNDPMPGIIGQRYEALGGEVRYIGKPFSIVYDKCIQAIDAYNMKMNIQVDNNDIRSQILCVGDSLDHDIKGAKEYGLDSLWTINGVHLTEMSLDPSIWEGSSKTVDQTVLDTLFTHYNIKPTYSIPNFNF